MYTYIYIWAHLCQRQLQLQPRQRLHLTAPQCITYVCGGDFESA